MKEFINQLGIDWHLLLSQAVNFFLLLVILRLFVYKPLLKTMKERRSKIEEGLVKSEEASRRLDEINAIGKGKIREAEEEALRIIRKTEKDAKEFEAGLLVQAKEKEAALLKNADLLAKARQEEAYEAARRGATAFIKNALIKTVELSPDQVDEALIKRAVDEVVKQ